MEKYCQQCSGNIELGSSTMQAWKLKKYCSKKCVYSAHAETIKTLHKNGVKFAHGSHQQRTGAYRAGDKHPNWAGGPEARKERRRAAYIAKERKSGQEHWLWKGGRRLDGNGYVRIKIADGTSRYEHRVVMELAIGRPLKPSEVVHHWDENKTNNSLDNLCLLRSDSAHQRLHFAAEKQGVPVLALKFDQSWLFSN